MRLLWNRHQMNVVRHEAIGENPQTRLRGRGAEPVQIDFAIGVDQENTLVICSALRNVMCDADGNGSGKSGHTKL